MQKICRRLAPAILAVCKTQREVMIIVLGLLVSATILNMGSVATQKGYDPTKDVVNRVDVMDIQEVVASRNLSGTSVIGVDNPFPLVNFLPYIVSSGTSPPIMYLDTDVPANAITITLHHIPSFLPDNLGWLVIDPFTDECEICQIGKRDGAVITLNEPLVYAHSAGDAVLLISSPIFHAELYGLRTGGGYTATVHTANAIAISRAVRNADLVGSGKVVLPPGDIELDTLMLSNFPDQVSIVGAGRDVTTLYPQETASGGQFGIEGNTTGATTFLVADADGSDVRLRVNDVNGLVVGDLIRIRDFSTDANGNGSWPYDARPGLYNGEYLYIKEVDTEHNEIHLVTPVQSSINYQVHATTVVSPGPLLPGDTIIPVADTTGYEVGTEVVIIQDREGAHIAKVVSMEETNITIDSPIGADVSVGNSVYIHVEVRSYAMTKGIRLADFSVQMKTTGAHFGGLTLSYLDGFSIDNVAVYGAGWAGIWLSSCVNGIVSNFLVQDGEFVGANTSYGVQTYHCQWIDIGNGIVRKQRRAIDLSGLHPSRFINVHDNLLEGSEIVQYATVAGTHGTAEYCSFTDNIIVGAQSGGLLIRGNYITIKGNQFTGTHLAAIVLRDGAYWDVIGNVLNGQKRWSVDSGGRFVGEFIRLQSPHADHLVSRGNVAYVETTYIDVRGAVRDARVWVSDDIIFRPGAPGEQNIVLVNAGSSVVLNIDSHAINYDNIYAGDGQVVEGDAKVVVGQ